MISYQALSTGQIQVQHHIEVVVDGVALSTTRAYVLAPHDDVSGEPEEIQQACADWWTVARVAAWDAANPPPPPEEGE